MKKQNIMMLLGALLISFGAMAHAPKKVILKFNKEKGILEAAINHKVKNTDEHYIKEVVVYVNDVEVKTQAFQEQTEKADEKVAITLENIKDGDVIKLTAKCNKLGKKSAKITVE